ncbi:MAG TPA: hypothetical protein VMU37_05225 [Caulobacteraceae bacterium]|nr:hypothetical protein [Caulobacteraceae bacterium]HUO12140.1 hypothetical protein [Caulobacteraceae bacterium]
MSLTKRFHLFLRVLPVVVVLVGLKAAIHAIGWEFMPLDGLIPSLIAGSIFLIGFLMQQVLADYREAEHMPADIRTALEAIHDDVLNFALTTPKVDLARLRAALAGIVQAFEEGLGEKAAHADLSAAVARVDALSPFFTELQGLELSERYVVRLRAAQDTLRRCLFRVAYIQKIQFVPSVHVLVQTLVLASLFVLLFLKTMGAWESMLIVVFVGYMFVYSLFLIGHLDQPFREGEGTVDDVSLFQLREFLAKIEAEGPEKT